MSRLAIIAAVLLAPMCLADQALIPIHHMPVQDVCDALVRNPAMIPQNLVRIWPLHEQGALLAEGQAEALARLREIVTFLDSPQVQLSIELGLIVCPAGGPDKFNPNLLLPEATRPATSSPGGLRRAQAVDFRELLQGYEKSGGKILLHRSVAPALVPSGTMKMFWLDPDLAPLSDPSALATGVSILARLTPDSTVALDVALVAANADPVRVCTFAQQSEIRTTVADGDSLIFPGHFLGEGKDKQEAILVIIPRVVFGAE